MLHLVYTYPAYKEEYTMKVLRHSFEKYPNGSAHTAPREEPLLEEYVSERVFKDKSPLCRIAIPYIIEEGEQGQARVGGKENLVAKKRKKVTQYGSVKAMRPFKPVLNYEKTPINEYLSYELSEEINFGLKEVRLLADEIKHIKDEKKKEVLQKEDKKQGKRVRIRRTNFRDKTLPHHSS